MLLLRQEDIIENHLVNRIVETANLCNNKQKDTRKLASLQCFFYGINNLNMYLKLANLNVHWKRVECHWADESYPAC